MWQTARGADGAEVAWSIFAKKKKKVQATGKWLHNMVGRSR